MALYSLCLEPFLAYGFMRRALAACVIMAISFAPIGVLLLHRRMSLVGDAMAHGILPGAAIGYRLFGVSVTGMALGGMVAGLIVAVLSAKLARPGQERPDASFAAVSLLSLAVGVILVSGGAGSVDLMHMLFGSVLAIDNATLYMLLAMGSMAVLAFGVFYRLLLGDAYDPLFMAGQFRFASYAYPLFIGLVALGLCAGFQALGTLMCIGLIIVPAAAARPFSARFEVQSLLATLFAVVASAIGLLLSYHIGWPAGPSIALCAGGFYLAGIARSWWG